MKKRIVAIIGAVMIMALSVGCGEEESYINDAGILSQYCGEVLTDELIKELITSYPTEEEFNEAKYAVRDLFSEVPVTTDLAEDVVDACHELFEMQAVYCKHHWNERDGVDFFQNMNDELKHYYDKCDELSEEFNAEIKKEYQKLNEELYE